MNTADHIPGAYLDAHITHGSVPLSGQVDYQLQTDVAFSDVARLHGVSEVTNVVERRAS
jgi:osmotically-inducible protein OsmY